MKYDAMRPEFVEFIPEKLTQGTLYVSVRFSTATHLCPCGCGREIPTPLSPAEWKLTFDGEVSLHPSIGSWSLLCRSHYFIRRGRIVEAAEWTPEMIAAGRAADARARQAHYGRGTALPPAAAPPAVMRQKSGIGAWIRKVLGL